MAGLYSQMMTPTLFFCNGAMSVYPALSSDELYNTAPDTDVDPFTHNALSSDNAIIYNNIWRYAYVYLYQANAILEGLENSTGVSAATKKQLKGEAKFIRAFCYFYLVSLFGDVPLITATDYRVNAALPRTPENEVYQLMVADLLEAQDLLETTYPVNDRTRPNKWTAAALLARVYLYQKDWTKAEAAATAVIHSGTYSLVADISNVFLANSEETIWQLLPVQPSLNTAEGIAFIPPASSIRPSYAVTTYLLNAFKTGDQRQAAWLQSDTVNGETYYYPYKYKVRSGTIKTEYNVVLRLAEQYLIRAEARAQLNETAGAAEDLNRIRTRAGLMDTTINDQQALLAAIQQERQVELFAEWGHRWLDLKRTGRADAVLGMEKADDWQSTDALYPIPFTELQQNPFLTQNNGY